MSDLSGYGLNGVSRQRGLPIVLPQTATVSSVTGETVQLQYISSGALANDAGQAAGVKVQGRLAGRHVLDSAGSTLATKRNTSLSFTAGALTTEVYKDPGFFESLDGLSPEAALNAATSGLSNGEYVVDYERGIIYGVKTTTASTLASAAYLVLAPNLGSGSSLIGKVNQVYNVSATDGFSRDVSAALEASSVVSAAPALLGSGFLFIDETAATDIYYLQFFNSTTVPADATASTGVISPISINHTTGTPTKIDFSFLEENGIYFSTGIAWAISTTQFTKTVTGNIASGTIFYKQ